MIGVTSKQAHKYETGANRVSSGRLYTIAQALEVEVRAFFESLSTPKRHACVPEQRVFLDLAGNFRTIRDARHRDAICC